MLGGGQLGRYFVMAAHEMGYRVWVLDPDPESPAGRIADRHLVADYADAGALAEFAQGCAAVSTEFENVPAETLRQLATACPVHPSADAVAVCQNRIREKRFLLDHGLPCGPVAVITDANSLVVPDSLFPAVLKVARFGYDGKGQMSVTSVDDLPAAWAQLGHEPCVLERRLVLDCELSVVLARSVDGAVAVYPVVENRHRHGILDVSLAPAAQAEALHAQARDLACRIASQLGFVGTLAVEFFVSGGALYVNEMAPRPHNSGHHTLDACAASQYDQQVRALCGLPLAPAVQHSAATMVNLLGDLWFDADDVDQQYPRTPDWARLAEVDGLVLHLYGKASARRGRKMGHFTVIGNDRDAVLVRAMAARAAIGISDA